MARLLCTHMGQFVAQHSVNERPILHEGPLGVFDETLDEQDYSDSKDAPIAELN